MASLPSSFHGRKGFSSVRFLGVLKQPSSPSSPNPICSSGRRKHGDGDGDLLLELDERDVFWSPASYSDLSDSYSPVGSAGPNSPLSTASTCRSAASSLSPSGNYPHPRHHRDSRGRHFTPERFGLSAALAAEEELGPLVQQRKPSLDPSASATSAAHAVPPVAGTGWDGYPSGPGKVFGQSAPVNVPVWPRKGPRRGESRLGKADDWVEEREWDGDDGEMVPPHLIVARSNAVTFSVFEGVGRTLKGRDLSRVRNAVFRKTGFLD